MIGSVKLASKILGRPLVDARDILNSCYAHLLRRDPDAAGLEAYSNFLIGGGSIDEAIEDFVESDEFNGVLLERSRALTPWISTNDVVEHVYLALLGREPDAERRAHYAGMLDGGVQLAPVIQSLMDSDECRRRLAAMDQDLVGDAQITLMQTCDGPNYYPLLEEGRRANEAYALQNGFKYECFVGIKRGYFPWHACFNRIIMLQDMVRAGYRGWVFYLDADAYVFDQKFDLIHYIECHADKALIAAAGGPTGHRWDINDGVFLINLGHPVAREIVQRWHDHFMGTSEEALRCAVNWEDVPSDQPRLHEILRETPGLMDAMLVEDRGLFNEYKSSFVRQALRGHGLTIEERLEIMRRDLMPSSQQDDNLIVHAA